VPRWAVWAVVNRRLCGDQRSTIVHIYRQREPLATIAECGLGAVSSSQDALFSTLLFLLNSSAYASFLTCPPFIAATLFIHMHNFRKRIVCHF
jgi:hypothetical protein